MGMNEEQLLRLQEAQKDDSWLKKVRMATTADELVRLYEEKGIDFKKEEISVYPLKQTRLLGDDELEEVAGGGLFGDCPQRYDLLLCELSLCPHVRNLKNTPKLHQTTTKCDNGFWEYTKNTRDDKDYRPHR